MKHHVIACAIAAAAAALLSACASAPVMPPFLQDGLPDAVRVPTDHKVAMETVGVGQITSECRAKAGTSGAFERVFVGPDAVLNSRANQAVGKYYGPPATWESGDGSKITGAQLAVSPSPAGNIPIQLVKANPASGQGAMQGVTYIQRVATRGGVATGSACAAASVGKREIVKYQADYIFWKAG